MALQTDRDISVQGILVPIAWDERGNATRMAVQTMDEDEYQLIVDSSQEGLQGKLRQEVVVHGQLRVVKMIKISSVTVVDTSK